MISRVSLLVLVLLSGLVAAPTAEPLAVGERLPAAVIRTIADETVTLTDAVAGRPTVLLFYRGGWCPYCVRHLAAVAEVETEILAAGFQIIALSPDQPAKLRAKPAQEKLRYALYSDSTMAAAQAFGIAFKVPDELVAKYKDSYRIDLEADSGQTHHLLPHPAVFIVDAQGIIRIVHVDPDYRVRLEPAAILVALKGIAATGN
jgi:peroxiredoxin